jgi:uncharacterized protein YjeT (DUF2065 family)
MSHPLESALAISFILVGLSHMLHGRRWAAFFEPIFQNDGGPFWIAMFTLPIGLLIVCTHNIWVCDLRVLVTIYGWSAIIKGSLYFLAPQFLLRYVTQKIRSPRHFAIAGSVLLIWGLLLAYDVLITRAAPAMS